MKKWIIAYVAACMLSGCKGVTKEDFEAWATKHDQALVSAVQHIDKADAGLTVPAPVIPAVRKELAAAKADIGTAQEVSAQVVAAAVTTAEKNEKLNTQIIGPRGKAILAGLGVVLALTGLVIVLVRYGGLGGTLVAIPILGAVVTKIGLIKPKA